MNATAASRRAATAAPAQGRRRAARSVSRPPLSGGAGRGRTATPHARAVARGTGPVQLVPLAVGRTAVAVSDFADSRFVHRLTRGRLWIGVLTTLLVGIVALNVFTLSFNASSSKTTRETEVLQRQNSALQGQIAAAGGPGRPPPQPPAGRGGLFAPERGGIGFLGAGKKAAAPAGRRLEGGGL